ncbi:mpv17-like protein isoform X3 [Lathamus discolor]|uniref:mpv17-like protein isoform X3 n=1 Tax=Lathamus discolor TaxID=678569 RepID=UPI0032B7D52D
MAGALLRGGVRRFPWLCNVLLYGGLFAAGDAAQQLWRRRGQPPDWAQTRRVALVALAFHGNFSYVWLRALERALPGRRPAAVLGKVLCDQLLGAPVAVLAFYTGMSILQKKEDIFSDCRKKFWNTYKTGLMYWPFVQDQGRQNWTRPHRMLGCSFCSRKDEQNIDHTQQQTL